MPSYYLLLFWLLAFVCLLAFPFFRGRAKAGGSLLAAFRLDMVLPLAGGLWLMCFAARSLIAEMILLPSATILDSVQHLHPAGERDLALLAGDLEQSLTVRETPAQWSALGMALALESEAAPPAQRPGLAEDAAAALRLSLGMAPANPYVWARLAVIREAAGAGSAEILGYLRLSWRTGPNEERLRLARIALALRHWNEVRDPDRPAVFADIRGAWSSGPETVLPLARNPAAANIMRAALVADLPQLTAFEKSVAGAAR